MSATNICASGITPDHFVNPHAAVPRRLTTLGVRRRTESCTIPAGTVRAWRSPSKGWAGVCRKGTKELYISSSEFGAGNTKRYVLHAEKTKFLKTAVDMLCNQIM